MPIPQSSLCCAVALAALASGARAAHPLLSEDTGTQGRGRTELELGTATSHVDGDRLRELDPQLSYGVLDNLDVIVRPSLFWLRGAAADAAGRRHGSGTTALDAKWRGGDGNGWTYGMRGGFDLPTASEGLGPHRTGSHVLLMATYDRAPLLATINVAYTRLPRDADELALRRDIVRVSAGALAALSDDVRLAMDVAILRASDRAEDRWPAVGVAGVIVRTPWGFDVDAGYQFPLNRIAPSGAWLVGATLRW